MAKFINLTKISNHADLSTCTVNVDHIAYYLQQTQEAGTKVYFNSGTPLNSIRVKETADEIREMISPSPLKVEDPTIDLF